MASTITHLVIGERVFAQLQQSDPAYYGAFLLGCVLVDVHRCGAIDRRTTHFAERGVENSVDAFNGSCSNFLTQLDSLLVRPWSKLTSAERAFVAGYLCHLAADEEWQRFDVHTIHTLGIQWWLDLPVPPGVVFSAFDTLSSELYNDPLVISQVLDEVSVPNVLTHIPYSALQAWWDVIKPRAMDGSSIESRFEELRRLGKTDAEIQVARHEHEVYWENAVALVQSFFGGVRPRVHAMVRRSLETVPLLLG